MGEDTTWNIKRKEQFSRINKLCQVASSWKYIRRNILTMHGPLNVKFIKLDFPELGFGGIDWIYLA